MENTIITTSQNLPDCTDRPGKVYKTISEACAMCKWRLSEATFQNYSKSTRAAWQHEFRSLPENPGGKYQVIRL